MYFLCVLSLASLVACLPQELVDYPPLPTFTTTLRTTTTYSACGFPTMPPHSTAYDIARPTFLPNVGSHAFRYTGANRYDVPSEPLLATTTMTAVATRTVPIPPALATDGAEVDERGLGLMVGVVVVEVGIAIAFPPAIGILEQATLPLLIAAGAY